MFLVKKMCLICGIPLLIAGCQSFESIQDTQDAQVESLTAIQMKELSFQRMSLHVQYGHQKQTYQATYQQSGGKEEALIRDHMNGVRYEGEEALNEVKMKLSEMDDSVHTINEAFVSELLSAFNLDDDYRYIKVNLTLADGTTRSFEKKQ
ncbi:YusW family protein [Bacillus sp. NPDC077027]|uniref:YusW family protein n=1 Tax=Bacillus sp. NPDC077027 TaxID=3390548 RepID=UPI003CFC8080